MPNLDDCYGHLAGDDCLVLIAQAPAKTIKRSADLVARYGSDELPFYRRTP
ncbi:diguanylate cyclase domain-containing protein [Parathermosynechococcus lividus]